MSGIFLTFEGLDGSGKTTQLSLLANHLRGLGFEVVSTCEPGGTILGRRIREILLDEDAPVAPLAELLLFAADRAQHVEMLVRPALERGAIVISDRYSDATIAYQGAGRGFASATVKQIIKFATSGLKPDLTLFFDVPVGESISRTNHRVTEGVAKNRLDSEAAEFHQKVRAAYLEIAEREPKRFRVVDAKRSITDIQKNVLQIVTDFLEARKT